MEYSKKTDVKNVLETSICLLRMGPRPVGTPLPTGLLFPPEGFQMSENINFKGFSPPKTNYFRLPNEWTNLTHDIKSLAEMKIIEYILRHTWGYQEFDLPKRITLNEFAEGRKKKDGTRIDRGIGMCRKAIIDGIQRAVEDGFITVSTEGQDKARIKKLYQLKMKGGFDDDPNSLEEEKVDDSSSSNDDSEGDLSSLEEKKPVNSGEGISDVVGRRICTPEVKNVVHRGVESKPQGCNNLTSNRERNLRKKPRKKPSDKSEGSSKNGRRLPKDCSCPKFCQKGGEKLMAILIKYDSDLLSPTPPKEEVKISSLITSIATIVDKRGIDKDRIKRVIKWLDDHYDDSYTPKMFSANDFATRFKRFEDAMIRWADDNGEELPKTNNDEKHEWLVSRIFGLIRERGIPYPYYQKEIDELLIELDAQPGQVMRRELL